MAIASMMYFHSTDAVHGSVYADLWNLRQIADPVLFHERKGSCRGMTRQAGILDQPISNFEI